jgi:hypothetical protein
MTPRNFRSVLARFRCLACASEASSLADQTTSHKSLHWKWIARAIPETSDNIPRDRRARPKPEEAMRELEREQIHTRGGRRSLAAHTGWCRHFFKETPPMPYEQLAGALGLSEGSIGFVRMRCLERLRRRLTEKGCS